MGAIEYSDPDRLLDVNEAAALLQVKPGTLYAWASRGKVPFRKVGALVRFHRGELLDWTIEQAGGSKQTEKKGQRAKLRVINSARSL
jgi:excisionase family DNA binding protein